MGTSIAEVKRALPTESEGPGIAEYLGVFRRRPRTIVLPLMAMTVLAGAVAWVIPPKYESTTRFKIEDAGMVRSALGASSTIIPHKPILATIQQDIKRPGFYTPIAQRLGLTEGYVFDDHDDLFNFYKYIDQNLQIAPNLTERGTDVITISYRGRDQKKVADFVSEVLNEYRAYFRRKYRGSAEEIYRQAYEKKSKLERDFAENEAAYDSFRSGPDYKLLARQREIERELGQQKEKKIEYELDLRNLEGQLESINAQIRDLDTESVTKNMVPNPDKAAAKTLLDAEKGILNKMLASGLTDLVITLRNQRDKVNRLETAYQAIPDLVDGGQQVGPNKVYETAIQKRDEILTEINGRNQSLEQVALRVTRLTDELIKIPSLDAQETAYRFRASQLDDALKTANTYFSRIDLEWSRIKDEGADMFEIIDFPRNTDPPVFPSVGLFLGIGAGVGLLLGIGLAFLKEFSGMTYMTAAQVQSTLPLPILGEVAEIRTKAEEEVDKRKRRRSWIIAGCILLLVGGLHLVYFHPDLVGYLPNQLTALLDKLYRGGR